MCTYRKKMVIALSASASKRTRLATRIYIITLTKLNLIYSFDTQTFSRSWTIIRHTSSPALFISLALSAQTHHKHVNVRPPHSWRWWFSLNIIYTHTQWTMTMRSTLPSYSTRQAVTNCISTKANIKSTHIYTFSLVAVSTWLPTDRPPARAPFRFPAPHIYL